jgi:hypothetical protein
MRETISILFAIIGIIISSLALYWVSIDTYHLIATKRFKLFLIRRSAIYVAGFLFAIHFILEKAKVLMSI